ncbi:MAG: hypothetical protein JXB13_14420 [Phycisphaerae bacterium]|nr:hypothetical protein [Phycisphaerae bacterium]
MSDMPSDRIVACCPACGAKLGLPASAVGRRAKCPQCEHRFVVEPSDADSGLDENSAAPPVEAENGEVSLAAPPAEPVACPHCKAPVPGDAAFCPICNGNLSAAPIVPETFLPPEHVALPPRSLARSAGAYLLGTALSALGALLGAGLWCGVAIVSGYEVGWIAWGLGGAAGLGMRMGGYRRASFLAGVMAALVAVGGILTAKAMLVAYYVWPTTGRMTSAGPARNMLESIVLLTMNDQIMRQAGVPETDEQAAEQAYEKASAILAKLSKEQIRLRFVRSSRSDNVCDIATADEAEFERNWLAAYRADRRANQEGLYDDHPNRAQYYEEERARVRAAPAAETESAIRDLAIWDGVGWLSDSAYVRTVLIYSTIRQSWERDQNYGADQIVQDARALPPKEWIQRQATLDRESLIREWDVRYAAAVREVDALEASDQVTRAREVVAHRRGKQDELVRALEDMPPISQVFAAEYA